MMSAAGGDFKRWRHAPNVFSSPSELRYLLHQVYQVTATQRQHVCHASFSASGHEAGVILPNSEVLAYIL